MEEQQESLSVFTRTRRRLAKEKLLFRLGPLYVVRSPLQYILLGWILAAGMIWMALRV